MVSATPESPLALMLGRVCPVCDAYNDPGTEACIACQTPLDHAPSAMPSPAQALPALPPEPTLGPPAVTAPPAAPAPGAGTMVMPAVAPPSPAAPASATAFFGAVSGERHARLTLVRGHTQFGTQWRLQADEVVIGRESGAVLFPDDAFLGAAHAKLAWEGGALWLHPLERDNGVFLRIRSPVVVAPGSEFVVGAQRLRIMAPADRRPLAPATDAEGTHLWGAPLPQGPWLGVRRLSAFQGRDEMFVRAQSMLRIGRAHCDVNFPDDGFLSQEHCRLAFHGEQIVLDDAGSRNGTFARVLAPYRLKHGDILMLGEQVLRVELPAV